MKFLYCLLGLLCFYGNIFGQDIENPSPGFQVPNIKFSNVVNHQNIQQDLNHFRKKIMIVDFWNTFCSACIREIPIMDSMQKKYPNDLSVILVNSSKGDTKEKVLKVLTRIRANNDGLIISLPIVLGDTILRNLFPHIYVPYFAILDSNLKVLAVTDADNLTPEHIENLIQTGKVNFKIEKGIQSFKEDQLLFNDGSDYTKDIILQSTFSRYTQNAPSVTSIEKDSMGKVQKVKLINMPIIHLLKRAYGYFELPEIVDWPVGYESILNPRDKPKEWKIQNCFTYQLLCEKLDYDSAMSILKQDIKRVFGYTAAVKKVPFKYFILRTANDATPSVKSNGHADGAEIIRYLKKKFSCIIVDQSSYDPPVKIDLQILENKSFEEIKIVLSDHGLILTEGLEPRNKLFIYHSPN